MLLVQRMSSRVHAGSHVSPTHALHRTALPPLQGPPQLYILTLGVLAPYRGMGAGGALLERCLQVVTSQLPEIHEAVLHVQVGGWGVGWDGCRLCLFAHGSCSAMPPLHRAPCISCSAQTNNDEAIRFYSRFGFEVGETVPGYYKRLDPPDAVVLRKRLQPSSGSGGDADGSSEAAAANGSAS